MPSSFIKQAYVKSFYCDSINFKRVVYMSEHMDIAEFIYKGVVEHSYKKLLGQMPTVLVIAG